MRRLAIAAVLILVVSQFALAEFGQSLVYFNVPVKTGFTVTLPMADAANASGATAPPGAPATADINFSSAVGTVAMLEPCLVTAYGGACQNGAGVPIFSYINTGNVNISMWLMFNATLPSGVVVGINSTKSGAGNQAGVHAALFRLNETSWVDVFENLTPVASNLINVTMYANFTNVDGLSVRLLMHNSTLGV